MFSIIYIIVINHKRGFVIMKVVIVGGGAGGISTASNIRKLDEDIEITVITRDNKVAYSPCAIPYVLSGTIESFDDIVMRTPEDYKNKNIDVIVEAEVTAVDSSKKTVTYEKEGKEIVLDYDKLVLATGGNPFVPPMEGVELDGVFRIRNIDDGKRVQEAMKEVGAVVEGYYAAKSAWELGQRQGVDMPITQAAYSVLYENIPAAKAFSELLMRRRKAEQEDAGWL